MRLPDIFVQEVIDRTDMEELVRRYVNLKRTGSNLVGLCPFHSEKTPSFTVTPEKKMFFCFGCHAGGSAITFVQKIENLEFADAVAFLADRAGLAMPQESDRREPGETVSRKRVLEANLEAAKFFRACLFDPAIGAPGMRYFKEKRGLTDATIKHFGLGYAPDTFGSLTEYMHQKGFNDTELQVAFLCGKSKKTGRAYDYFRGRVMFPILDNSGNVVAFGGRVLDDSKPKYLNTSDTPAFKKSNHLFALNFARHSGAERMILCEGYMDVIALHAAGFETAVATLGTAITPSHARIFSKYTKQVVISYDADEAGQTAAKKAMQILGDVGIEVRVLRVDGAKDPDEYIRKFGADRFAKLLDASRTGFEYQLETILHRYDLSIGQQKIQASTALCSVIADYSSAVEREVYLNEASKRLDLPVEALRNNTERIRKKRFETFRAQQSRDMRATIKHYGDLINPEAAKDPKAAAAEEAVIGMLLMFEEYRRAVAQGQIPLEVDDFVTDFHRRVFSAILQMQESEGGFRYALLGEQFTPDEMGRIRKAEMARRELTQNGPQVFRSAVEALRAVSEQANSKNADLQTRLETIRKNKLHKKKGQEE